MASICSFDRRFSCETEVCLRCAFPAVNTGRNLISTCFYTIFSEIDRCKCLYLHFDSDETCSVLFSRCSLNLTI